MPEAVGEQFRYPRGLVEWAGHRSGGVRRMFDHGSGRPAGVVVETPLIRRLAEWATDVGTGQSAPCVVLLVGGPGNGKTEAVETTLERLDASLGLAGALVRALAAQLSPAPGLSVPRVAPCTVPRAGHQPLPVAVVQDASLADTARPEKSPAELLLEELELFSSGGAGIYFACVNRGILDDALILAIEQNRSIARKLLETITRSVAFTPDSPACWPLDGYPNVAVWPMDVETIFVGDRGNPSAASTVLDLATHDSAWPEYGRCAAGVRCPFCYSRRALAQGTPGRTALLNTLRYHELASGKRWTFRDLFSLIPQLFASGAGASEEAQNPCEWAAKLLEIDRGVAPSKSERIKSTAIFSVASSTFSHVLFSDWERNAARRIQQDARELGIEGDRTVQGLCAFLKGTRNASAPATLKPLLSSVCALLDPAIAKPELEVHISKSRSITLGELDARFSHSVGSGLEYLIQLRCLSPLERELLGRVADCEQRAVEAGARNARALLAARRIQFVLRDFACRWARRSLGAEYCALRDLEVLTAFQSLVDAPELNQDHVYAAAKKVEGLLNRDGAFEISLNTTFGEPLPPSQRQATLVAGKQRVRPITMGAGGRPRAPLVFLAIGEEAHAQTVPLTYDLYRAVVDLSEGLVPASLPATVVALLDATRARLGGVLVRDARLLEDARIRVGTATHQIAIGPRGFVVVEGGRG